MLRLPGLLPNLHSLLSRCMSVNPLLMDMMAHASTMDRVLAEAMAASIPLALGAEHDPSAQHP